MTLLISLSGSKDTHRGWGMKQRFFWAFHVFYILYLLRTLWDLCEDQIFRKVICKPQITIQLQELVHVQDLWVNDGEMNSLKAWT